MKQHPFVIPSVAVTQVIGGVAPQGVTSNQRIVLEPQSISGAAGVRILAIGDQPFCVTVQESCASDGPFLTTHTFCSVASGGSQVVSQTFIPIGGVVQLTVVNGPAPQSSFTICATGTSVATTVTVQGTPGSTITTSADTSVPAGTTQPLTVPPLGTRRMTVQNTGPAGTWVRVRELGGTAGAGKLLPRLGEYTYGGADGAIGALEVQDVSLAVGGEAVATTICVQFERN